MLKFKTSIEVEAAQWDGTSVGSKPIIDWVYENKGEAALFADSTLRVSTPSGTQAAVMGDWIVQGVHGEFYVVPALRFTENYEAVYTDATPRPTSPITGQPPVVSDVPDVDLPYSPPNPQSPIG